MSSVREEVPRDIAAFAECWNRGQFFAAHEILEVRWMQERDSGLQGLIQLAAALHHLSKGNLRGAKTMIERAERRLCDPGNAPCAIDEGALAVFARQLHDRMDTCGPQQLIESRPLLLTG
jgi:predicted metal-dependent hydrolase